VIIVWDLGDEYATIELDDGAVEALRLSRLLEARERDLDVLGAKRREHRHVAAAPAHRSAAHAPGT
jgi:hypothetical protein